MHVEPFGVDTKAVVEEMAKSATTIQNGAMDFLFTKYFYMGVYVVIFGENLMYFTGLPTTVAFVVGGVTSIPGGWIGLKIAVLTNVRTASSAG